MYDPSRLGVTPIDLSGVPAPSAIQPYDQPTLTSAWLADFVARDPAYTVLLESQPAIKLNETGAYREFIQRQRVNDAQRALLLTKSYGSNLDALGARFGCYRLMLVPPNPNAYPQQLAIMEDDDDYRSRIALCPDAWSGGGPEDAYKYQCRTADGNIKDVAVYGHPVVSPGTILCVILTDTDDQAQAAVRNAYARLIQKNIKVFTDNVQVRAATPLSYSISAVLHVGQGPTPTTVQSTALSALAVYQKKRRKVAGRVAKSGIDGCLNVSAVNYVELLSPLADIVPDYLSYADCSNISLSVVVDR